jgi:hypothetical protein
VLLACRRMRRKQKQTGDQKTEQPTSGYHAFLLLLVNVIGLCGV